MAASRLESGAASMIDEIFIDGTWVRYVRSFGYECDETKTRKKRDAALAMSTAYSGAAAELEKMMELL